MASNAGSFTTCLEFSLNSLGITFPLKEKQLECLKSIYDLRDTVAVLPTGYGKSLIFQLLPYFMQRKYNRQEPMIVIIVVPLNSIMEDQVQSLLGSVSSCFLSFDGTMVTAYETDEAADDCESQYNIRLPKSVEMKDLKEGEFNVIYAHPEALRQKAIRSILQSKTYQERVCAVAVDEVHMVSEWGEEFRPAFKQLGEITCIFPNAGHLALTATATEGKIKELVQTLQYKTPNIVSLNPDRPNVFIEVLPRLPNTRKYDKLDQLIEPFAQELAVKQQSFPLTVIYMENLEALGYCYQYLSYFLKDAQYVGDKIPENRIFAQYHKDYTEDMKHHIIHELTKDTPRLRLVLATVALGMGLDAPSIERIVHCRPPSTIEEYMQEIGRAGRKGQAAHATLYYNNSDIAKSRKGLSEDMQKFCRNSSTCLRLELVKYFGFTEVLYAGEKDRCCSNCRKFHANEK